MLRYGAVVVVLLAVAGVSHALSDAEKAVRPKKECDAKASNCLSYPNSFKCAMAFRNLTKADAKGKHEIKILDIIPDLINQPGVELTPDIQEELVNRSINFPAFDIADVCGNKIEARKRSNARCYAFLNDFTEEDLDSCDTGLITSDGDHVDEGTVGDALCDRAFNSTYVEEAMRKKQYKQAWVIGLVDIGAYHSYCGTDWQEVATGTGKDRVPLRLKRKLCCFKRRDPECKKGIVVSGAGKLKEGETCQGKIRRGCPCPQLPLKPKYRPCSGSKDFNRVCEKKK